MNIDPYTAALVLRALGLRKVVIRLNHVAALDSHSVELQQVMLPQNQGMELTVLEPVIEGEAA